MSGRGASPCRIAASLRSQAVPFVWASGGRIANVGSVTSLAVDLVYDPALLSTTATARAPGIPADWTVNLDTSTTGVAKVTAFGTSPLSGAEVEVLRLTAAVPNDAPYGAIQAIQLQNVSINGGVVVAV